MQPLLSQQGRQPTHAPLLQVVEVEAMKQVVQEKLGCGPNFKYHYRLDKDVYEGYALPHRPHQAGLTQ